MKQKYCLWFLFVRQCHCNSKYFLYFKRKCKKSNFTNFDIVKCIGSKFDQLISLRRDIFYVLLATNASSDLIAPHHSLTSQSLYGDAHGGFGHSTRTKSVVRNKVVPDNKRTRCPFFSAVQRTMSSFVKCFPANNFRCQSFVLYRNTLGSLLCCIIRVDCV